MKLCIPVASLDGLSACPQAAQPDIRYLHIIDLESRQSEEIDLMALEEEDSIWLNSSKTEVVIKVAAEVATYFKQRKLIAGQKTIKELEDGGLILSGQIAHPNQIWPTVRAWIPHVRIISPESLQADMELQLKAYLNLA